MHSASMKRRKVLTVLILRVAGCVDRLQALAVGKRDAARAVTL